MDYDVAIIGGGPSGSTVASLVKLQNPDWRVAVFEAATFPRDHVGESLLPASCSVLDELGVWDKVESAGFPVKLGGLYRWGVTDDIYPLTFLRGEPYRDDARPAHYEDQRKLTTFQVDRGVFDKILLDHSVSLGCEVFEGCSVTKVEQVDGLIEGLVVRDSSGEERSVTSEQYVDASGSRGVLRKALGIPVEAPSSLRNIAIYDYWRDADWGTRHGEDGTHIHVMSIDWGWLWFIVIGQNRTSVGLVTSAAYYKQSKLSPEQIYLKAIEQEPLLTKLLGSATREGTLKADSDWSYLADRLVGNNWFLAGDSSGFADPILSAGVTLAMTGARKVAYTLTELGKGVLDPEWLKSEYERVQKGNIRDHIRFADYWYSVNAKFSDLKEYCTEIARDAGLNLDADEAFRWLGTGGFAGDAGGYESPSSATFRLSTVKSMIDTFGGQTFEWQVAKFKRLHLNLQDAARETCATYYRGRVVPQKSFRRGESRLFLEGFYKRAYIALAQEQETPRVIDRIFRYFRARSEQSDEALYALILEVLEAMMLSGWIVGEL